MRTAAYLLGVCFCLGLAAVLAMLAWFPSEARKEFDEVVRARLSLYSYLEDKGPATRVISRTEALKFAHRFSMDETSARTLCDRYAVVVFVPYDDSTTCLLFFDSENRAAAYILGSQ